MFVIRIALNCSSKEQEKQYRSSGGFEAIQAGREFGQCRTQLLDLFLVPALRHDPEVQYMRAERREVKYRRLPSVLVGELLLERFVLLCELQQLLLALLLHLLYLVPQLALVLVDLLDLLHVFSTIRFPFGL